MLKHRELLPILADQRCTLCNSGDSWPTVATGWFRDFEIACIVLLHDCEHVSKNIVYESIIGTMGLFSENNRIIFITYDNIF